MVQSVKRIPPSDELDRYIRQMLEAKTLNQFVKEAIQNPFECDVMFGVWLVSLSITEMRPNEADRPSGQLWRQWLSFALRYLSALERHREKPYTFEDVVEFINDGKNLRRTEIMSALMYGSVEQTREALNLAFDDAYHPSMELNPEQRNKAQEIFTKDYDSDSPRKWSKKM